MLPFGEIWVLLSIPDLNFALIIHLASGFASLSSWIVQKITDSCMSAHSITFTTRPVVSFKRVVDGVDLLFLLSFDFVLELLVFTLLQIVLSQN